MKMTPQRTSVCLRGYIMGCDSFEPLVQPLFSLFLWECHFHFGPRFLIFKKYIIIPVLPLKGTTESERVHQENFHHGPCYS